MSANNTAAASDTGPVFVCCEIIMSLNLLISVSLLKKKKHLFPCFVFVFFLRLLEQLALSISHKWLLAPTGTQNRGSSIGFLKHTSGHYFWSHPAVPFPRALSFRSRQLTSTLLQRTAIFQVMNYVLTWLYIAVNDFLSSRGNRVPCIFWSSVTHSSSCMKPSCPASGLYGAYPSVVLAFLSR